MQSFHYNWNQKALTLGNQGSVIQFQLGGIVGQKPTIPCLEA